MVLVLFVCGVEGEALITYIPDEFCFFFGVRIAYYNILIIIVCDPRGSATLSSVAGKVQVIHGRFTHTRYYYAIRNN